MNREQIKNFEFYTGQLDWLKERTIFLTLSGSHAYGTNLPTSDLDIKGVCIPPKEYYLGILDTFEQTDRGFGDLDGTIFGINKFVKLAADCNPNIIELLFAEGESVCHTTSEWRVLYKARDLFISKKARHTFSGYAFAQLKRIETHRKWLLNPPHKKPERADFGLTPMPILPKHELQVADALIQKELDRLGGKGVNAVGQEAQFIATGEHLGMDSDFMRVLIQERKFNQACRNWEQYTTWKEERNETRSALEAKFGYDTKHGMHLVRLMRMCMEIMTTGKVLVKRPDAEELLSIRAGAWSYEDLMAWAQSHDERLESIYQASTLPHSPDRQAINNLLIQIVSKSL